MWITPNDPEEKESEAASYGGYTGRKEYEKQARGEKSRPWLRAFALIGTAAVLALAAIGTVALVRGDFFVKNTDAPAQVVTVPSSQSYASVEEMVQSVREYTVLLTLELADGTRLLKSGFIMTEDGYVLTDSTPFLTHSVASVFAETNVGSVSANLTGIDEVTGAAVVRLQSGYEYGPILFAKSDYVKAGAEVFAVSASDADYPGCVQAGRVMTVVPNAALYDGETLEYEIPLFYVDFSFFAPGSPLVNSEGRLVGFCTAEIAGRYPGSGAVIPSGSLAAILNRVLSRNI